MKAEIKIGIVFILGVVMFFFLPLMAQAETIDTEYLPWFIDRCAVHDVPLEIILAIAIVESNIKMVISPQNTNGTWDIGIMQLNSKYIDYHQKTFWYKDRLFDANDPEDNIEMSIFILKNLYIQTGNWDTAVKAYNVGCSKLKRDPDAANAYFVKVINIITSMRLEDING